MTQHVLTLQSRATVMRSCPIKLTSPIYHFIIVYFDALIISSLILTTESTGKSSFIFFGLISDDAESRSFSKCKNHVFCTRISSWVCEQSQQRTVLPSFVRLWWNVTNFSSSTVTGRAWSMLQKCLAPRQLPRNKLSFRQPRTSLKKWQKLFSPPISHCTNSNTQSFVLSFYLWVIQVLQNSLVAIMFRNWRSWKKKSWRTSYVANENVFLIVDESDIHGQKYVNVLVAVFWRYTGQIVSSFCRSLDPK